MAFLALAVLVLGVGGAFFGNSRNFIPIAVAGIAAALGLAVLSQFISVILTIEENTRASSIALRHLMKARGDESRAEQGSKSTRK